MVYYIKKIIFSSSATVYGNPHYLPCDELHPTGPTNPYGQTKLIIENILKDLVNADNNWSVGLLRYFNPVGAHISGLIGEDPSGIPNNLTPYISQVAVGKLPKLFIFGDDYDTIDGTGVRDFIHVSDLVDAHLKVMSALKENESMLYNIGIGQGFSMKQVVEMSKKITERNIPVEYADRREGDPPVTLGDASKIMKELGWQPTFTRLEDMIQHTWDWKLQIAN
jgi:UDP-glucose 4-epimerase